MVNGAVEYTSATKKMLQIQDVRSFLSSLLHLATCAQRARDILKITDCQSRSKNQRLEEGPNRKWKVRGEPAKGDRQERQQPNSGEN